MTVKIVTDSLGNIPSEIAEELGITIIPIYVRFGTETYRDGVDLTTEQFYEKLMHTKILPTTAVPPLGDFVKVYDKLAEESDEILVITISHKLSATYEGALHAIELMKRKRRVEVIDSLTVLMAEGLMVIAAAKAAKAGASFDEVVNVTRNNIGRVDFRMAFDTLEYLKRGGRIGTAQAFLGSILKVNPILTMKDGYTEAVARTRSRAKAIDYLCNFAMSFSHIDEMAVEDATTPDEAEMLVERISSRFPKERIYRTKVSPVVGTHVGPHVLGVSVLGDRQ
jgi:fatty acid kinase fatty acid binding subunit